MTKTLKHVLLGGAVMVAGSVQAVTFSNVTVSGAGPNYTVNQVGNSLVFAIPGANAIGSSMLVTLTYDVDSDPGMLIDKVTIDPTGYVKATGQVFIASTHDNGIISESVNFINNSGGSLGSASHVFANKLTSWNVTTTLDIEDGKVTAFTASYDELPVPEPASIGAITIGLVGFAARRARRNR